MSISFSAKIFLGTEFSTMPIQFSFCWFACLLFSDSIDSCLQHAIHAVESRSKNNTNHGVESALKFNSQLAISGSLYKHSICVDLISFASLDAALYNYTHWTIDTHVVLANNCWILISEFQLNASFDRVNCALISQNLCNRCDGIFESVICRSYLDHPIVVWTQLNSEI